MHKYNSQEDSQTSITEAHCCINKEFVKSVPEPTCLLNLQCRIVMINDRAMKLFGPQSESFFIGKSIFDFIIPENHPKVLEGFKHCLTSNLVNQSDYLIRTEDGTILPIRTTSFTLSGKSDQPIALLSLVKDASNQKELEETSIESLQKSQLYFDLLGHDISNNLQVMMSSAELLLGSARSTVESSLIQNIIDSIMSCKRIIYGTDILESYQDLPLKVQYLDIIVETALLELIGSSEDISVHANIQICDAAILSDEYVICLLSNILENARIHNTGDDKQVWVTLSEDLDGYILSISDNGPGIASDMKTNGTCLERRSTGIGLYICHALIEKYKGWIQITDRVKNQPDQGTQVLVWFPQYKQTHKQD